MNVLPPKLNELADAEFPPPVFGPANLYEWPALTLRSHEQDHQLQVAGILQALGK